MKKNRFLFVMFTNIFVMYMIQACGAAFVSDAMHDAAVQFIVIPALLLLLNVMLVRKRPLPFYQYATAAYAGFFSALFVFAGTVLVLDHLPELTTGVFVLEASMPYVLLIGIGQFFVIICVNIVAYIGYKLYVYKNPHYITH